MNAWATYWAGWFFVAFTAFLVPETWALITGHPENTLSAQVWRLEGVTPGQSVSLADWSAGHVLIGGALALTLLWLIGHFVLGWWH